MFLKVVLIIFISNVKNIFLSSKFVQKKNRILNKNKISQN